LGVLDTPVVLVVLVGAGIEKGVLFSRVAMEVEVYEDTPLVVHISY
jgi:hypothetical protein